MEQEARSKTPREEELAREGWEKKFTAMEPKLTEHLKMYEELGFEVHTEPVTREELGQECTSCYALTFDLFQTIYTRPRKRS